MIFPRATLIGCGMIGGSLMAALRQAGVVERVRGYDRRREHAETALARGLIDEAVGDALDASYGADLIVLAVPVGATADVCAAIAPAAAHALLVTDVGSTKLDVVAAAERSLNDASRFCGAHPMAGTERSGPEAADGALFVNRLALITPTERTSNDALDYCSAMWKATGARTMTLTPAHHDRVIAWVSHLPHATAFALAAAVGGVADEVSGLSGAGFADTTRIAASDPAMWRDIFVANRAPLLAALDALGDELAALRRAIDDGDEDAIESLVARARSGRSRVMESRR